VIELAKLHRDNKSGQKDACQIISREIIKFNGYLLTNDYDKTDDGYEIHLSDTVYRSFIESQMDCSKVKLTQQFASYESVYNKVNEYGKIRMKVTGPDAL
jgi:hypothetical protein